MSVYICPCCGQTVEPDDHSGPERERAAVVKFLRSVDNDVLRRWADAIERGEHHSS